MNMEQILSEISSLASSQGFYGRLLRDILYLKQNDPERYNKLKETLEAQKFGDAVDMVLFFEQ